MNTREATAEVFFTAFQALSHDSKDVFFLKILKDQALREDLIDIAIAESRHLEPKRSFRKVVAEIKKFKKNR